MWDLYNVMNAKGWIIKNIIIINRLCFCLTRFYLFSNLLHPQLSQWTCFYPTFASLITNTDAHFSNYFIKRQWRENWAKSVANFDNNKCLLAHNDSYSFNLLFFVSFSYIFSSISRVISFIVFFSSFLAIIDNLIQPRF